MMGAVHETPHPTPPRHVVVTLTRSGGFAGVTRQWTADSAALPGPAAQTLRRLVAALPADPTADPTAGEAGAGTATTGLPDAFSYEVAVSVDGLTRQWRATDGDSTEGADDGLRALVDFVRLGEAD